MLTIKQRLCDSREYKDPVEMVWDTGQGNSVDHLKRTIANFLLIPEKDVLLAKYFPSKCEWTVLKDSNTQHNNKVSTSPCSIMEPINATIFWFSDVASYLNPPPIRTSHQIHMAPGIDVYLRSLCCNHIIAGST